MIGIVLCLEHRVVAEGGGVVAETVLVTAEIEEVAVPTEPPVAQTRYVKTDIPAVLVIDARGLGKSVAEGVVEIRAVIAVEGNEGNAGGGVKANTYQCSEAPVGAV